MKVSEILLNYLLTHKKLQLTGLGTFNMTGSYTISDDDKSIVIPQGAVEFKLDQATPEDPELVAAISKETGKIRPLASADLDSLIIQGKQLMNISKPFVIEGIGTLQKNHRNEIEYIPFVAEINRNEHDRRLEEPGEAVRFDDNYLRPSVKTGSGSRFITVALLTILALGILGAVVYYVYSQSAKNDQPTVTLSDPPLALEDTNNVASPGLQDSTTSVQTDTLRTLTSSVATVSRDSSFLVVLEIAKKDRAMKRYADLREWGHKVIMTTKDSVSFKISFPIKAPLADTAKYRDSLAGFFARKVWIEKQ
ncbi:MAG TPA: hypothetical protein VLA58_11705 [Chitinophagaceae bacterium]|nr:hypothetical protein [Chitinophagaceae bacterium]